MATWSEADADRADGKVSDAAPVAHGVAASPHEDLYRRVIAALYAVPSHFTSELNVVDVEATDLHQFNTPLGGAIEIQTVRALNNLRELWDPESEYPDYTFVRQTQRFPDVVLRTETPGAATPVIMGIELKGWYVLSKELEPTYRMKVNAGCCAPLDLLVVYPWAFSNVVSGSPQLLRPFISEARYAAEMRNWYWQHNRNDLALREAANAQYASITFATGVGPYPLKSDLIHDVALHDSGNNFGRVSRSGIMDEFLADVRKRVLAGIPVEEWVKFLKKFTGA